MSFGGPDVLQPFSRFRVAPIRAGGLLTDEASVSIDGRRAIRGEGPADAGGPAGGTGSLPVRFVLLALRAYKILLSPLFAGSCRFTPSCSEYMAEAVRRHGVARGGWLGVLRLARCHPFGAHGFDPVP